MRVHIDEGVLGFERTSLARWLMALCLVGCHTPADNVKNAQDPTEVIIARETSPQDPFEGVFPPAWKVGDRWRVSMKTEVPAVPVKSPMWERTFADVVFDFRVLSVSSSDDGVFEIDIQSKEEGLRYVGKYRKKPFSFVRLEDERGKTIAMTEETNPAIPYVGEPWGKFIKDYPIMPLVPRVGVTPFVLYNRPATQEIERTAEGLRFTIVVFDLRVVINWKRGAPWWSSVERTGYLPPLPVKFLGSGELLGS